MIITSATINLQHIMHARSSEPKFQSRIHAEGELVETNNVSPSKSNESPLSSQNRNAHNFVHTVQLLMDSQYWRARQAELTRIQEVKPNNWRGEVQASSDYNAYRAKFLIRLSDFQHKWDGHLSELEELETEWKLLQSMKVQYIQHYSKPYPAHSNLKSTKLTRCWRWMVSNRPKGSRRYP